MTDTARTEAHTIRTFIDCRSYGCYENFIKTETSFLTYVRDQRLAELHILITTASSTTGGTIYSIEFIGNERFSGISDTLTVITQMNETENTIQELLAQAIKAGSMRYVAKTPLIHKMSIDFQNDSVAPQTYEDPWDSWVYSISSSAYLSGEKSNTSLSANGSISANRITPDWKIKSDISADYSENNFDFSDMIIRSYTRSQDASGLVVRSVDDNWSVGAFSSASSSIYSNIKLSINVAPAIEYDIFPYSESARRQFRFLYRVGYTFFNYNSETIYDKLSEHLFSHTFTSTADFKQSWGTIGMSLRGAQYFHDLKKINIRLYSSASLPVFQGFSLYLSGSVALIRDQLSLPKKSASAEEILLRQLQLETSYSYSTYFGISYSFGSIYSNVINPRF